MKKADLISVSKILRHADPKVTAQVYGHLTPEYLRDEIDRLSFRTLEPVELRAAVAAGAVRLDDTSVSQQAGVGKEKAGTPPTNRQEIPAFSLERETGFEPATLSLGS